MLETLKSGNTPAQVQTEFVDNSDFGSRPTPTPPLSIQCKTETYTFIIS